MTESLYHFMRVIMIILGVLVLFLIVYKSFLDGLLAMLAYDLSDGIDWTPVSDEDQLLLYSWERKEMFPLPADETLQKRRRGPVGTCLHILRQSVGGVPTFP